jgi:hypothetical protein
VGGVTLFTKKSDTDKYNITLQRIEVIEKALAEFVDTNGFLPCPAVGSYLESNTAFGTSTTYTSPSCGSLTNSVGMLPVRTLGIEDKYAYDGWERKFSFRIASGSGNAPDFNNPAYSGDISIVDSAYNEQTNIDAYPYFRAGAAYVIISYGPNGQGAWRKNNATTPTTPTSSLEALNATHLTASPKSIYVQQVENTSFGHILAFKKQTDIMPAVKSVSPVKIPNYTCTNANIIFNSGTAGLTPTAFANQVYNTAMNLVNLCNAPPVTYYSTGAKCNSNPLTIQPTGLVQWFDASDLNNGTAPPPADQALVTTWSDKSASAADATYSGSTNNAKYNSVATPYAGNRPSLYFNSSWYTLNSAYYTGLSPSQTTIFVVEAAKDNLSAAYGIIASTNGVYLGYLKPSSTANPSYSPTSTNSVALGPLTTATTYSTYQPSIMIATYNSATQFSLYARTINNTIFQATNSIATTAPTLSTTKLGGSNAAANYVGYLGEIIVYNTQLAPNVIKAIEGYLVRKWFTGECP